MSEYPALATIMHSYEFRDFALLLFAGSADDDHLEAVSIANFSLTTYRDGANMVLWSPRSRAHAPACIVLSLGDRPMARSATRKLVFGTRVTAQLFEQGADDFHSDIEQAPHEVVFFTNPRDDNHRALYV